MALSNDTRLRIGVIGGGSWGTALANLLAKKGHAVDLWVYESDVKAQIQSHQENQTFLPGVILSENLRPTNNIARAVDDKSLVLIVAPSHVMRETTLQFADSLSTDTILVSASKGIENETLLTMNGVLAESLPMISPDQIGVLSGPSFAREVTMEIPTAVTVASINDDTARFIQRVFATPYFRVYTIDDVVGVELGGAVKNVIAIAAGVIDGLKLGRNTRAALITRGQTEIRRLGLKMGAQPRTFTGLAGIGDLVLTCTSEQSRNHTVGKRIGEGETLSDILKDMQMVAEGVKTARSVYNLSRKLGVDMPICHTIYQVLYDDLSPREGLFSLMTRDLKYELDDV
jgi:glycerol-3-phosphate dehydrogenase (NAD(P)+)